ncbi:MAG: ABC transporter permease [Oceanospirillaceae bacterium]|uniref:ABC transporter permease n=1 Tax=unclassified Thalassolituus TaxID=2624967 RepID=UPI000C09D295|nr:MULTISPECIES: ABC transporter permease [unclassified Thalassolituus]MAK90896.1 ABC transporter permease [Thalassolituus sp.]MAS25101.1 ABC transporter permease [Oceanospirillaceae bacterium]MAX97967.1 ABC transporter permease [Oceanospirillaceae bacterium]MBL34134.1 ABC transporter permease [Oceanospirillaceae bacterium]MBS52133.1 ABC transporter permease [Oceanospirillaceae bacterium]|tara:strand:- start:318 stop:1094 length:777 start_codon:yes stop_codon:yes gene_type:complete
MTDARIQWVAFKTILVKEIRRFMRIWQQTLLPPAITMTLYFVIFGQLIGSRIGDMDGVNYMSFIVPGLIMMSVITNSYGNVASSFFSNKWQRSVEELMVSPVRPITILIGYISGGVARGIGVGIIVTLLSLYFTHLQVHNVAVMVLVILLSAILFSIGGFINAMMATKFDDISIVPTFIITPLTYLGGVFYSISLLPDFWRGISMFNPILYMVNTFRYGILGVSDVNVWFSLAMLVVFIVLLGGYSLWLLKRGKGMRQ